MCESGGSVIYWAEETDVSNCEIVERGFSPKGRPSVLPVETKRRRVNMIPAISGQGSVRFMVYQDTVNQQRLVCFMERLVRASKQKVFLNWIILRFIMASLLRPGWKSTKRKSKRFSCLPMLQNIILMNI